MSGQNAPSAGSRKQQAARTEAELKDAARRVFARRGYLNTKITDITREAGRAAGSFYTHFDGKESLLEAMLADMLDNVDAETLGSGHNPDFSVPGAVRWHVDAFWHFFSRHRTELVALQQAALVDERFAERLREMYEPDVDELRDHLERAVAGGVTLPADPAIVATMISSLMMQFAMMWQVGGVGGGRKLDDDEAVDALTAFVLHGLHGTDAG
ncbi:MAG TPA: TetR/AcrR family transcriptional regulator [Streptosporangiaceae bacterium]